MRHLLLQLVGQGVGHHGLACPWCSVEQHHHPSTIGDGVVQTHLPATPLVALEVTDCVQNQLLLFLAQNHLMKEGGGGREGGREREK